MDLTSLRGEIDRIDKQLLSLFEERMDIVQEVARYKMENGLPIFHPEREQQVLDRAAERANAPYKTDARVLFTTLMELSKFHQKIQISEPEPITLQIKEILKEGSVHLTQPKIACQGTQGAYSHIAAEMLFPGSDIVFTKEFEDVFKAVENDEVDCGLLPIDNSNAGSVTAVYSLMKKHDFYINYGIKVKVDHCLAARPGVSKDQICNVYSHEQALRQCSGFFEQNPSYKPCEFSNTAMAAKYVSESDEPAAAICSVKSAELYGLQILESGIQDSGENYTRFMCISKIMQLHENANMISIAVAISNQPGSLYKLLTAFSAAGVDLTKIESKPIGTKNFDVIFYIDFLGNLRSPLIYHLINNLAGEFPYFKFLGNYPEIEG